MALRVRVPSLGIAPQLPGGGVSAVAASVLAPLGQSASAAAMVPTYAALATSVLAPLGQAATAAAAPPAGVAVAASVLAPLGQAAQAAAAPPAGVAVAVRATLHVVRPVAVQLRADRARIAQVLKARLIRATLVLEDGMTPDPIVAGEALRVALRLTAASGAPVTDATGVQLRARTPTGAVRSYPPIAGAPGEWAATVLFDEPGRWWILGECGGPTPAVAQLPIVVAARAV